VFSKDDTLTRRQFAGGALQLKSHTLAAITTTRFSSTAGTSSFTT
jgi:hypothetical protein